MRFSVIIPVYNVEQYIDKCMDTVMHQTFDDYEVIVVNDETPDNSMDIVQKYVKQYPEKIRVIHQKNTRQGGARNNGVAHAVGEYILFVDSDDYVAPNMLEVVDARLRERPADILVFDHIVVTEHGKRVFTNIKTPNPGFYKPIEHPELMFLICAPWNKAYRRSFYLESGFQFPKHLLYEDGMTRFLYAKAESLVICGDVLYYYVHRRNSSMRQNVSEKMLDILPVTDMIISKFKNEDLYEHYRDPLNCALIYGILNILDLVNAAEPEHPMQGKMGEYIASRFPDYRENPWVTAELRKSLDCILARDFRRYHWRFLRLNKIKDRILRIPGMEALNRWRKRITT